MECLRVNELCKKYEAFYLDHVSFSLEEGKITGFIGRNGAGKTTTLKSMLNMVHPDSGDLSFFGLNFKDNEEEIKRNIGFVSGGVNFYPRKKIKTITDVTKKFYKAWDETAYQKYMNMFKLDENKTPSELSEGMKVKYSIVLALSHHAKLLILDEPTSGLDPVSRDDLLDVFLQLMEEEKVTILFSTHITSDLEKCADSIIYIKDGKIYFEGKQDDFLKMYKTVEIITPDLVEQLAGKLIGCKKNRNGYSAIIKTADLPMPETVIVKDADLETIMVHIEKEES